MKSVQDNYGLIYRVAMKFLNASGVQVREGGKLWSYTDLLTLIRDTKRKADEEGLVLEGLNSLYKEYQAEISAL